MRFLDGIFDPIPKAEAKPATPDEIRALCNAADGVLFTGSSVICDPPVLDTDIDIMVHVETDKQGNFYADFLLVAAKTGGAYPGCPMETFRIGKYNILLTDDEKYFNLWKCATRIATQLNLKEKKDRQNLFRGICQEIGGYES